VTIVLYEGRYYSILVYTITHYSDLTFINVGNLDGHYIEGQTSLFKLVHLQPYISLAFKTSLGRHKSGSLKADW